MAAVVVKRFGVGAGVPVVFRRDVWTTLQLPRRGVDPGRAKTPVSGRKPPPPRRKDRPVWRQAFAGGDPHLFRTTTFLGELNLFFRSCQHLVPKVFPHRVPLVSKGLPAQGTLEQRIPYAA